MTIQWSNKYFSLQTVTSYGLLIVFDHAYIISHEFHPAEQASDSIKFLPSLYSYSVLNDVGKNQIHRQTVTWINYWKDHNQFLSLTYSSGTTINF